MEAAHSFRVYLQTHLTPQKPTKTNPKPVAQEKPDRVTIWVAKNYPAWQCCILTTMNELYKVFFYIHICWIRAYNFDF